MLFLDRLEPEMCVDDKGAPCAIAESLNLRFFKDVMERFDLGGSFSLFDHEGKSACGLSRREILERTKEAALLLNFMGYLKDEEILSRARRRVFFDIDPGFGQMWRDLGLHDAFIGHDDFVTIGENIGKPECGVPACGLSWITTPQPVVLDYWPVRRGASSEFFTSIVSWRGAYQPIEYRGETYGLRVQEFRKFAELPRLSHRPFQLALDIHPAEVRDLELLRDNGWSLVDPRRVVADPWKYQQYIQNSKAEFMVAKGIYVKTRSGWFSDRSICYLASGRPVVAQNTGLKELYPTGEGLLTFTDMGEALAAVEDVAKDYSRHSRAARAVAEEFFDSDKVLRRLVDKLGVG